MDNDLKQKISSMTEVLMSRNYNFPDYESDKKHLNMLETLILEIEKEFTKDKYKETLGGEFKSDSVFRDSDLALPLFFHIDLMILAIENNMKDTHDLDDRKKDLTSRLKRLREKAVNSLEYDSMFDPEKHLSEYAIKDIAASHGDFLFNKKRVGNDVFLTYDVTITTEDVEMRHGDYYSSDVSRNNLSNLLYQEDIDYLKSQEEERDRICKPILEDLAGCFKDDKVPGNIRNVYLPAVVKNMYNDADFLVSLNNLILKIQSPYNDDLLKFSITDLYNVYKLKKDKIVMNEKEVEKEEDIQKFDKGVEEEKQSISKNTKRKSIFSRFIGRRGSKSTERAVSQMDAISEFENARNDQIKKDNEVRDVVMYQRKVKNGQEVLVPLSSDEYKVVKR